MLFLASSVYVFWIKASFKWPKVKKRIRFFSIIKKQKFKCKHGVNLYYSYTVWRSSLQIEETLPFLSSVAWESISLSNSKVQAWEDHLYSNSIGTLHLLTQLYLLKNKPVNRNETIQKLPLAWFCCEKALRGLSEAVETCSAKGLKHLSCQRECVFDTYKNGPASFMTTAGYLSKKSILCELAEDLLVF